MRTILKTGFLLVSIFTAVCVKGQDNGYSKNTLKYGLGIGVSDGYRTTGGVINNTKGLLGTGGYPPSENKSDYISDWHYGGFLGGGFRITPKNSRIAIEVMPLNFHVGADYYMEGFAKIGLEVKLR